MKIFIVCQYFYPEQFRVNDICFELAKEGHEVTVLTGLPNYPSGTVEKQYRWFQKRKEEINGVHVVRSWLLGRGKGSLRLTLNYLTFAISASLKTLFSKRDFDLILVYQLSPVTMALPGILQKKLSGKPMIIYCHDLWPESIASAGFSPDSFLYRMLLFLSWWIYVNADLILTSSQLFEEYFRETLKISGAISHLPVYAEEVFEKIDAARTDKKTLDLVFAGNIGEMQSVDTIILAANELKDEKNIFFHIIGDGSSLNKCRKLSAELGTSNIIFHGRHPVTEMPRFYEMADAFLITLKKNKVISYTLPNKVQSYMAAGKPIIGAIDGETREVIDRANCGLCVPAEDYQKLADIIRQFAYNIDNALTLGRNARLYYDENFSKEKYMDRLNSLIQEIAHKTDK